MLKKTEDFQKYVKMNASIDYRSISPFIIPAMDKYLTDYIPDDLMDQLSMNEPTDKNVKLIPHVERAIALFTVFLASPHLDISVQEGGFMVNSSDGSAPASAQRVSNFIASLEASGWDAIESLLKFLEKNKTDYPLWVASDCYTMANKNLINSAVDFDKIVPIDKSRLRFIKFRSIIDKIEELRVIPMISKEQYLILKTSTSPKHKELKDLFCKAIAFYVATEEIDIKYTADANMYLSLAKVFVDKNLDDFPEYFNSASFTGVRNTRLRIENETNKVLTFGAPPRRG